MGRSSRNARVASEENRRNRKSSTQVDVFEKSSSQRDVERDLLIPPIEIARGNPHTGKIGSQRPAAEQHNRMISLQEGRHYREDSSKNEIPRVESNRLYAEIRGQLYSRDAFNLPRGILTMGKMRQNHFRKLMQLRKSLEKRCVSMGRAVGHWSADNFVDDVLRRDRLRGLTPRSKYFERDTLEGSQNQTEVPTKRKVPRIKEKSLTASARKERRGQVTSRNHEVLKRVNTAPSADSEHECGKRPASGVVRTHSKPARANYSDTESSDDDIRNIGGSDSEPESDEYQEYERGQRHSDEFSAEFGGERESGDEVGYDSERDAGMHVDDHSMHTDEEETELFQSRKQILQLRREASMEDLSVLGRNDEIEHHSVRRAKPKSRKRKHGDAKVTRGNLKLKKRSKR